MSFISKTTFVGRETPLFFFHLESRKRKEIKESR